ncbi:HNH endonuclease [Xanthobacter agilis]|uniref:HNH nuclease domain-containing protein n=1 Tax=Xanthobacter agilis TaxID=47492 RepID=A0ABU0LAN1_XANAG|nr:HNH endonuclease [Xanthobacter agilis]MDQ0504190.1 hypothetical protein [Xanthobacter agilis]
MHISLGVRTDHFPIDDFLDAHGKTEVTISAVAGSNRANITNLAFSGNPQRRGGEWRIRDQYSNRHPAWTPAADFPSVYDTKNPPYIFIFKIGKTFYARFVLDTEIAKLTSAAGAREILDSNTGLGPASPELIKALNVPRVSRIDELLLKQDDDYGEPFDPKNIPDGKNRIIAEIVRRLGQQAFRRKLVSAYGAKCAMTRCKTQWVLEAAHIVPYRGLKTNAVSNGLLLRADVHTLFDLGLISVDPKILKTKVSNILSGSEYEELDGRELSLPSRSTHYPSIAALEYHYSIFHP